MAAGDFYFAINATFRHILERFGKDALVAYWRAMGTEYYGPLAERFRAGGLDAVEEYWRGFFAKEPGGDVVVTRVGDAVEIDVRDCPALRWLRDNGREPVSCFCEHCHHVSSAIAERAGMDFKLEGGGGSCRQRFSSPENRQ